MRIKCTRDQDPPDAAGNEVTVYRRLEGRAGGFRVVDAISDAAAIYFIDDAHCLFVLLQRISRRFDRLNEAIQSSDDDRSSLIICANGSGRPNKNAAPPSGCFYWLNNQR
jgi:hypothetical protein